MACKGIQNGLHWSIIFKQYSIYRFSKDHLLFMRCFYRGNLNYTNFILQVGLNELMQYSTWHRLIIFLPFKIEDCYTKGG